MRHILSIGLFISLFSFRLIAEQVTPSDRIQNFLKVRQSTSGSSAIVGHLYPGERAPLISSTGTYHKIRLTDGTEGYVSKAWSDVVPDATAIPTFRIHFLDVGTGDSSIVDVGTTEIIIDGGDSVNVLRDYIANNPGIIDGPIELIVVTHGDSDHWKGINRLLNFDGGNPNPPNVLEFWEPGYDRGCSQLQSYDTFISNVQAIPGILFRRPLEATYPPAVDTGQVQPLNLPSLPDITITVLHTDSTPTTTNGDCAYLINNASIVLKLEIGGYSFLFTGDANGKERSDAGSVSPGHIEAKLLALEQQHPGTLRVDVLKVPHHGSESASTQVFIDAVNPQFAIISASTKHHLPRETVVDRYRNGQRVILTTDENRDSGVDHVVCYVTNENLLDCNFVDVLNQ